MKLNKALVKHETRNMKWMLLYFLIVAVGGITTFNFSLKAEYMAILRNGIAPDTPLILSGITSAFKSVVVSSAVGIMLLIYLQFKDSKSVEVGNFLKALPISNKEYFVTKFLGGLISLTIPTLILMAGVLAIRSNNMIWVSDIHSISIFPEIIEKADSIINIASVLTMSYLVAIATYSFLFMIQYVVMNISAGILIGGLVWFSPTFIAISVVMLYEQFIGNNLALDKKIVEFSRIIRNYIEPWSYPVNVGSFYLFDGTRYNPIFDEINTNIMYYDGLFLKIIISLIVAIASIIAGYALSKKSKVEDSDTLIAFRWARKVFIAGVTVCSAFLLAMTSTIFTGRNNSMGFLKLHAILLIGGIIGFLISKKITAVKNK